MVGDSESAEYRALKAPDVHVSLVWILLAGRSPTQAEFATWKPLLKAGTKTVADLATNVFATSTVTP